MAASKSIVDDTKVMDVARPGKGKAVGTSRPVIGAIVSNNKSSRIDLSSEDQAESVEVSTPTASRKIIKPLDEVSAEAQDETLDSDDTAPNDSPVIESLEPSVVKKPSTADESSSADNQSQPSSPEDITEDSSSESAGVDALVAQTETKRQAAKRAEEEAKHDAEIQKLTDSKKYYVPISHGISQQASSPVTWAFVVIILVIALLSGVYILADAGVIDSPVALPLDLIK